MPQTDTGKAAAHWGVQLSRTEDTARNSVQSRLWQQGAGQLCPGGQGWGLGGEQGREREDGTEFT